MLSSSSRILFLLIVFVLERISSNELTFELPDNAKECFHEILKVGSKYTLEFQVSQILLSKENNLLFIINKGGHRWKL
jgi:hypothetical protein